MFVIDKRNEKKIYFGYFVYFLYVFYTFNHFIVTAFNSNSVMMMHFDFVIHKKILLLFLFLEYDLNC